MKIAITSSIAVLGLLLSQPILAQSDELKVDETSPVKHIRTIGNDGGEYFVVACKGGKQGSVARYQEPPQVCAGPPRECRASWPLVSAAEFVCGQK